MGKLAFPFTTPNISIRTKLIIIVLFLAVLPWFGFRYLWEIDGYLKLSQQQTLLGTSQAVATALHQRPELFSKLNKNNTFSDNDFYVYPIPRPIIFNGKIDDWATYRHKFKASKSNNLTYIAANAAPNQYQVNAFLATHTKHLFVAFDIKAPSLTYPPKNDFKPDASDHLLLSGVNSSGKLVRYLIAPATHGKINSYLLPDNPALMVPMIPAPELQGKWNKTTKGYLVELSFPSSVINDKFAYSSHFVDPMTPTSEQAIVSSNRTNSDLLGNLIIPSTDIEEIVQAMSYNDARIWVLNHNQQVLASSGDIHSKVQSWDLGIENNPYQDTWLIQFISPIYRLFSEPATTKFIDPHSNATSIDLPIISKALKGFSGSQTIITPDKKAEIIASASPIWNEGDVVGSVYVEQTTLGIRQLRNQAMRQLVNTVLTVMILASLSIVIFATGISNRLRKLKDQAELAIDDQGKVTTLDISSSSKDEIGDLSRSFSLMLQRLGQYNHYLENMSSRLSHELRTPVSVIRSSLEHVQLHVTDEQPQKYLHRAQEGLQRLNTILNSMTEATRLESTLLSESKQKVNLTQLIKGCVEGYRLVFPTYTIASEIAEEALFISGVDDFIAQLFDKLINNAIEFSSTEDPIHIQLFRDQKQAVLQVTNVGPYLPNNMADSIFESMISIRKNTDKAKPHLGLGLFIASLITQFHQGTISATNRDDVHGVIVKVSLPILDPYSA
ncbi:MAG: proteobacterial dedicated sortase system histidine kinase [Parashewanella sp.]